MGTFWPQKLYKPRGYTVSGVSPVETSRGHYGVIMGTFSSYGDIVVSVNTIYHICVETFYYVETLLCMLIQFMWRHFSFMWYVCFLVAWLVHLLFKIFIHGLPIPWRAAARFNIYINIFTSRYNYVLWDLTKKFFCDII